MAASEKSDQFLKELKELMIKYNASFWVDLDGDTHCVSDYLVIDVDNKEILRVNHELDKSDLSKY